MTTSLISVNVGLPKTVQWRDQRVTTGIFKSPVEGSVALRKHNLEGDGQADLTVHGGPTKAVYVYPTQHYTYWREELPDVELGWGHFGENFTVDGMDEESIQGPVSVPPAPVGSSPSQVKSRARIETCVPS